MTGIGEVVAKAREGQAEWEQASVSRRLRPIRALRHALAADPFGWAEAIETPQHRTRAESLAGEVLTLADACGWLQRRACRVLRPRREGGWLFDPIALQVERKPWGVVLVIGASNFPLILLAAPAIQALAAGNAVLLKPPPGAEAIAEKLRDALVAGGLDPRLCGLLGSSIEAAEAAIDSPVDHLVATGSTEMGRAVARRAAETLTPCTLECSGADPVVVLPGADLQRAAECVAWGVAYNAGATCIAPRRLVATIGTGADVAKRIDEKLCGATPRAVSPAVAQRTRQFVLDESEAGSRIDSPSDHEPADLVRLAGEGVLPPIAMTSHRPRGRETDVDLFAPLLRYELVDRTGELVAHANASRFALGASVFGPTRAARRVARRLRAGCVTINDVLAPTGDARTPFGGSGDSGYGVTRGREGLLAMTRPQAIVTRRGRWLAHLDPPTPALDGLLAAMVQLRHSNGWTARWRALRRFFAAARSHSQAKTSVG